MASVGWNSATASGVLVLEEEDAAEVVVNYAVVRILLDDQAQVRRWLRRNRRLA